MKIAILTKEQHRDIYGKLYTEAMYFNPVLDKDGNIIISEQEVNQLTNETLDWVKDITLIEKDTQLKELTKEEWLEEDKKLYEQRLLEIEEKLLKEEKSDIRKS